MRINNEEIKIEKCEKGYWVSMEDLEPLGASQHFLLSKKQVELLIEEFKEAIYSK